MDSYICPFARLKHSRPPFGLPKGAAFDFQKSETDIRFIRNKRFIFIEYRIQISSLDWLNQLVNSGLRRIAAALAEKINSRISAALAFLFLPRRILGCQLVEEFIH